MKNVLYLQTGQKSLSESARELLTGRSYQALFCDEIGERSNLEDCLECLEAGDTLFVLGERQLADSMGECALILSDLAIKGVNVWIERNGGVFSPESSPFSKDIAVREVDALFQYIKISFGQALCETSVDGLMEDGMEMMSLPDGFGEEIDWVVKIDTRGKICSRYDFWYVSFKKLQHYLHNNEKIFLLENDEEEIE